MRRILLSLGTLALFIVVGSGCSTTARFRLPPNTSLEVTDRTVNQDAEGKWKTSPFFWSSIGGANYTLYDKNHNVVRSGKLKTKFRVVSIFWPPFAIIYWPVGLREEYDLTTPGNGYMVRDNRNSSSVDDEAATAPQTTAPAPKSKTKSKKTK